MPLRREVLGGIIPVFTGCYTTNERVSAVESGDVRVEFDAAIAALYLRYRDDESGETRKLRPENANWLFARLQIRNLSETAIDPIPQSRFTLKAKGRQFEPMPAIPKIDRSQLRESGEIGTFRLGYDHQDRKNIPGESAAIMTLLFDAPYHREPLTLIWVDPVGNQHRLVPGIVATPTPPR